MQRFLDYIPGNSIIHRLDPRTKLLLSVFVCIGCFSCDNLFVLIGFIIFDLAVGAVGGIMTNALRLLKTLLKISVFLFVLQILFIRRGDVLLPLPFGLSVTDTGVLVAVQVVLRLIGAAMPLTMMLTLTKMSDLSGALVSRWHIPYKYAFAVTSAIRFIPSFSSELNEIMEVQTARGVEFDTKNFFKKIGLIVPLCVPLLISSVQRIDSSAIAAELRGFNLRTKDSGYKTYKLCLADYLVLLIGAATAVIGILF